MEAGVFQRLIEPNDSSLRYLQKYIVEQNADFAIGLDCDADRVEIVLREGNLVSGNDILAIIIEEILSEIKNPEEKTIVVNDATSYLVKEIAEKYKANWQEVEVGEINVVDKMLELSSPIAGEGSNGGVIIPPTRCRDGILTILFLLKVLENKKTTLKELIKKLPKYHYVENRKPHDLSCGRSKCYSFRFLSILKTRACDKPTPLGVGGLLFF
ncbi:MAG: hypothetical protein Q8N99_01450 [Nanoarchaeota archaeon]|nr:hypothetical protein [Nanoarchaeota archaeon]